MGDFPFGPVTPGLTQTATVYVTTNGSDSNSGLSWQSAFATVDHAVTALGSSGGVVEVGPGTFTGTVGAGLSGLTIAGRGPQATTLTTGSTTDPVIRATSASGLSDIVIRGMTITGHGTGSGGGILASANGGALRVERLSLANLVIAGSVSHAVQADNCIMSRASQIKCSSLNGRGLYLNNGTTWSVENSWFTGCPNERGFYANTVISSTLLACGSDSNAIGYELASCGDMQMLGCDVSGTVAANGLDGTSIKVNACAGVLIAGSFIATNRAVGLWVTGASAGIQALGITETAGAGATASVKTDSGNDLIVGGINNATATSYAPGTISSLAGSFSFFNSTETGTAQFDGLATLNGGTATAGSAPVITPTFSQGVAAQLSDTTRDYMVYLQFGAAGTAMSVAVGPANTTVNTLISSAVVTAGETVSFRVPAGWWTKVSFTTTTLAHQAAIGC